MRVLDLPSDALTDPELREAGGKAAGLGWLRHLGVDVPAFAAISPATFRAHLRGDDITVALGRATLLLAELDLDRPGAAARLEEVAEPLRAAVETTPPPAALGDRVAVITEQLGGGPYAVRSSMVGEDGADHSFAGQLESVLHVPDTEGVIRAVLSCWGSAFSPRAIAYAARAGVLPSATRMGVVVQRMIDTESAGVVFTANPVTGIRDECVVSAAPGLGEGVVSGRCAADEHVWSPDGSRRDTIAEKTIQIVRAEDGSGTIETAVPEDQRTTAVLTDHQIDQLCRVARSIAASAGRPLDIEWGFAQGRLHILQARPITALPPDPGRRDTRTRVFDNSNVQESYNGVLSPLTFSFASRVYAKTYDQFAKTFCVSQEARDRFTPKARTMVSQVRGRIYYNLESWDALLALVPNSEQKRADLAQIMWHTDFDAPEPEADPRAQWRDKAERALVGGRLLAAFATVDRLADEFDRRFHGVYDSVDRQALEHATLEQLHATLQRLWVDLGERWDAPTVNNWRVLAACGRLRRTLVAAYGEEQADLRLSALLGGIEGIESVKPARMLVGIAADIRTDPETRAVLEAGTPAEALAALHRDEPAIAARIDEYVDRYGDRSMGELKLENATPRDDPSFVIQMLRNYVDHPDIEPDRLHQADARRHREARADLLRQVPRARRRYVSWQIDYARKSLEQRERLRIMRTLCFGLARDLYRNVGRCLAEAGAIDTAEDVYFLSIEEIEAFAECRAVSVDLHRIVAARREEWARYAQEDPPNRFQTAGSPYAAGPLRDLAAPQEADGDGTLRGLGSSGGVVEAPIRLIFDAQDELSVNGSILCTVHTDPGWALLFPTAAGVIVERGSHLSHAAVVAREFGIPAVIGVPDITRILRDGERVRIDGDAGTVTRLDR
ncbi:MAG: hypothetical protein JHC95_16925 [Solirubrobacteraceae bacterium]|nr:hypothetical protein [Solirubrobacteraceae bacterium]